VLKLPKASQFLSLGFQAATYVTAQVHLAEISAKLGQIEATARDIIQHLEESQAGKLLGAMGRLKEISTRLQEGLVEADEVGRLHHQIDDIDLQAAQIAEALKKELLRREQDVQDARV